MAWVSSTPRHSAKRLAVSRVTPVVLAPPMRLPFKRHRCDLGVELSATSKIRDETDGLQSRSDDEVGEFGIEKGEHGGRFRSVRCRTRVTAIQPPHRFVCRSSSSPPARSLQLANHMVMAPMTRSRATPEHTPDVLMATYYGQRATAGLIITEGMQPHSPPRAMTEADIAHAVKEHVTAAKLALDAGFDGVELHGANGYLNEGCWCSSRTLPCRMRTCPEALGGNERRLGENSSARFRKRVSDISSSRPMAQARPFRRDRRVVPSTCNWARVAL